MLVPKGDRGRKLVEPPDNAPGLGSFFFWSVAVLGLMCVLFVVLRRVLKNSRYLLPGGLINVLARKPLSKHQEIFLIELGARIFVIGSTREGLVTLGDISDPDQVAAIKSRCGVRTGDSVEATFRDSLRQGLLESERPPGGDGDRLENILGELAEMKKTVRRWRA